MSLQLNQSNPPNVPYHAVKCLAAWAVSCVLLAFVASIIASAGEASLAVWTVTLVLSPIGACSQLCLYPLLARHQQISAWNGAAVGFVAGLIVLGIMILNHEPFFTFAASYILPCSVLAGIASANAVYPRNHDHNLPPV